MKAPDRGDQADRVKRLEKEVEFLQKDRDATQRRLDKALAEVERLRKELEEALRSLKRQFFPVAGFPRQLRSWERATRGSSTMMAGPSTIALDMLIIRPASAI